MNRNNFLIAFILILFFSACKKDVNILIPESRLGDQVFIECILVPGEKPKAYVSQSTPFFDSKVTPQDVFARGAQVEISDGMNIDVLTPDSLFDKFRCRYNVYYAGETIIEHGKAYDLTVTYKEKTYTASTSITQSKVEIDSVTYTPEFYDVYGGHDGVIVHFKDVAGEPNFYRFQMNRMIDTSRYHAHVLDVFEGKNDCTQGEKFFSKDLGRTIFNDEHADGLSIEMIAEVSFEYEEGDTTWVIVQSLDPLAAEFFQDMDDQLQSILNPFVEPVFIDSHIEGAIGVFGSAVLSDSLLFIYPQDNP